ncbi:hypothetical protein L1047_08095 [Synechococcus sp. Nb3U1]|uniref:choice-of-anchor Q domain-containing protein n=1 Tax=Synechococcus sp. Nb3U1 TaxID=1914529 RepID=UPI001F3E1BDF|nr:choice-of-anchor Q domain-containing protein [Synechococcus sp. Nb3U1]MCF2971152.1 hypothetical protein [Synechococcus sp. Nb3U1]
MLLLLGSPLATLALWAGAAEAATITVNSLDQGSVAGQCTLRDAIEAANTNAAVQGCTAGDSLPTVDTIDFSVTGIITLVTALPTITEDVVIDGPGATDLEVSGNNLVRVFDIGNNLSVEIEGLTISNGNTAGDGGGIRAGSGTTLTVSNSTLSGNSAGTRGGGIRAVTATVSNSTLSGNSANFGGGGIFASTTATVSNSTLSGNSAGSDGGGIYAVNTATVSNSTLSGNSANFGGGGIRAVTATVSNSTLSGNSANFGGGGIRAVTATVSNSTLSGNSAGTRGGGIFASTATVSNSTLSGNSANFDGGGIRAVTAATVNNSIIAGNTGSAGNEECSGSISGSKNVFGVSGNAGGCPVAGNIVPTGAISTVLQTTLAANGTTIFAGVLPGTPVLTLALVANSPALEAADPGICAAAPINNLDQRGVTRPQPASTTCDIGAFESALTEPEPTPTPTATPTPEPTPTPTPEPTPTPIPTPTPTATPTPEPTPTPTPTATPTPEPTPTPTPESPNRPPAGRLVWDPARLIVQETRQEGIPTLEVQANQLRGVVFDFRNLGGPIRVPVQVCVLVPEGLAFSSPQLPLQASTQVIIAGVASRDFTTQFIPAGQPVPAACQGTNRNGAVVVTLPDGIPAGVSGSIGFQVVLE